MTYTYCAPEIIHGVIKLVKTRKRTPQASLLDEIEKALVELGFELVYYNAEDTLEKAYRKGDLRVVLDYASGLVFTNTTCRNLENMIRRGYKKPLYYI